MLPPEILFGVNKTAAPTSSSNPGFGGSGMPFIPRAPVPLRAYQSTPFIPASPNSGAGFTRCCTVNSVPGDEVKFGDSSLSFGVSNTPRSTQFGFGATSFLGAPSSEAFSFTSPPASSGTSFPFGPSAVGSGFTQSPSPFSSLPDVQTTPAFGGNSVSGDEAIFGGTRRFPPRAPQPTQSPFRFPSAPTSSATFGSSTPAFGFCDPTLSSTCSNTPKPPFYRSTANDQNPMSGGTRVTPYMPSYDSDGKLMSISAMNAYKNKSHEELRSEDYHRDLATARACAWFNKSPVTPPTPFAGCCSSQQPFPENNGFMTRSPSPWFPSHKPNTMSRAWGGPSTGFDEHLANTQCGGSCVAPYTPTYDSDGGAGGAKLESISAMGAYMNKSHEELRSEDYQQWNIDSRASGFCPPSNALGPSAPTFTTSNPCVCRPFAHTPFTAWCCEPPRSSPPFPSEKSTHIPGYCDSFSTGPCTPLPTVFPHTGFGCTPSLHSARAPQDMSACGTHVTPPATAGQSQGSNLHVNPQPIGVAFVPPPLTNSARAAHPKVTSCPPSSDTLPQYAPFNGPFGVPTSGFVPYSGPKGVQSTAPTAANQPSQHVSNPAVVAGIADHDGKGKEENDSHIPKGLEVIVEKLGFNPWTKGMDAKDTGLDYPSGFILPCEEADKDENIIALAEFAVEQQNALDKGGKLTFSRVATACLEPLRGGKYHIVIEARAASIRPSRAKKFYAAVSRFNTTRLNPLMVLQEWVPSE